MKKVTIRDVATRAGVSYQTVSRVINNHPDVAAQTREHVRQVVEELGYFPNATARSLASQKTRTLGVIVPDFHEYVYIEAIIGAEQEAKKQGYFFMLGITESDDVHEPEYFRLLAERRVEGILFLYPSLSTGRDHHYLDILIQHQVPLVTIAYQALNHTLTIVNVDNTTGGYLATRYLVEQGHRHIGLITGPPLWEPAQRRTEGYQKALAEAGIAYNPTLIEPGDWSYESGERAMRCLLARAPQLTAVFAQNDPMAIGALRALRAAGKRVPQDLALIGYDDIPVAPYIDPALTTIRQPMREVGRVAARLLIEALNHPEAEPREILLTPTLVRRDSA